MTRERIDLSRLRRPTGHGPTLPGDRFVRVYSGTRRAVVVAVLLGMLAGASIAMAATLLLT